MSEHDDFPLSGSIPIAVGQPSVVRIPIPGEHRLAVELWPRNYKGESTSTLFIQTLDGKKHLRLDYGWNKNTQSFDYHWNQRGVYDRFGIPGHTSAGRAGQVAYRAARGFRSMGRLFVVAGVLVDAVSIVRADQPIRRATQVVSAWALSWAACRAGGYVGGAIGTAVEPGLGTAGGAIVGCIVGGYGGYRAGEAIGNVVYQWAENTVFTPLPEVPVP